MRVNVLERRKVLTAIKFRGLLDEEFLTPLRYLSNDVREDFIVIGLGHIGNTGTIEGLTVKINSFYLKVKKDEYIVYDYEKKEFGVVSENVLNRSFEVQEDTKKEVKKDGTK